MPTKYPSWPSGLGGYFFSLFTFERFPVHFSTCFTIAHSASFYWVNLPVWAFLLYFVLYVDKCWLSMWTCQPPPSRLRIVMIIIFFIYKVYPLPERGVVGGYTDTTNNSKQCPKSPENAHHDAPGVKPCLRTTTTQKPATRHPGHRPGHATRRTTDTI